MIFLRKIRKGKVKINGRWFKPTTEYNGKLDGLIYGFGIYPPRPDGSYFISLWGSKALYDCKTEEEIQNYHMENDPEVMPDGSLPWCW